MGLGEELAPGSDMFIPGMFICCGDAEGDAEGMGMLWVCGVDEGVGEGEGICIPGIDCIAGVRDGDAFGVGVAGGIGIPCLCCA
jgi:hypothetical protein